jgi:two-component system OmpR family sensor kinase
MSPRVSRLPLRLRLVAGFAVAMLVLLAAAGAFVYWRVEYALDRGLDTELRRATQVIAPLVRGDGTVESPQAADATGLAWQVLDAGGTVLDSGGPAPGRPLVTGSELDAGTFDVGSLLPVSAEPYRVRISRLTSSGGPAAYLLVGVRRDHRDEALRELLVQLAIAGLGALAIASAVGYLLARLALAPVERYRRRADEIGAAGTPDLRLDVPRKRDDEVTRLGHTLNHMLSALQQSLDRERRFVDDASHELRTPLTLLTSRIQLTRRRPRSTEEHEAALDELAVDVARLTELTEQLLTLSQDVDGRHDTCDAAAVVRSAVARWRAAQPERVHELTMAAPADPVPARIHAQVLERMVTNLLTNALTHGGPPVSVEVRREEGHAVLQVSDAGPGMSPELLQEATRRFHRAPQARARPGAGLGLSIVEKLVTAVGGELRLCADGQHSSSGVPAPLPCRHDGRMTVTVVLQAPAS